MRCWAWCFSARDRRNRRFSRLIRCTGRPFSGLRQTTSGASRLRWRYKLIRAKFTQSRLWFLAMPLYLTLSKPKTRFRMRNGCSTLVRTLDLLRFFFFCRSSPCQHVAVGHAGRARRHRVDVALLRIHADMCAFNPKYHCWPFLPPQSNSAQDNSAQKHPTPIGALLANAKAPLWSLRRELCRGNDCDA